MRFVIVDTDVASFLFKQDSRAELYAPHLEGDTLQAVSFMTLAELEQWSILRNWGPARRDELADFVSNKFVVVDSNDALCRMWAVIRAQAKRAGQQIEVADAWIAATALLYGAPLLTHNAGDFEHIPGLDVITEGK
jgi:predicted nucleic acid-binding protein